MRPTGIRSVKGSSWAGIWYDFGSESGKLGQAMTELEKITIIEGPPPTFEAVGDPWVLGLVESPVPYQVVLCRLRTFNGPRLVERCFRAWREGQPISLEYRAEDGLSRLSPIVAARNAEVPEGHLLLLWVRMIMADSASEQGAEAKDWGEGTDEGE